MKDKQLVQVADARSRLLGRIGSVENTLPDGALTVKFLDTGWVCTLDKTTRTRKVRGSK